MSDDESTPPTLKRCSTAALDESSTSPVESSPTELPHDTKRAKTVSFEDQQDNDKHKDKTGDVDGVTPEHTELLGRLCVLLHNGRVTTAALLSVFAELETLPHVSSDKPADERGRAIKHLVCMDLLRVATDAALAKAKEASECTSLDQQHDANVAVLKCIAKEDDNTVLADGCGECPAKGA